MLPLHFCKGIDFWLYLQQFQRTFGFRLETLLLLVATISRLQKGYKDNTFFLTCQEAFDFFFRPALYERESSLAKGRKRYNFLRNCQKLPSILCYFYFLGFQVGFNGFASAYQVSIAKCAIDTSHTCPHFCFTHKR